jgi:excisionase family DNA binding protein
LHGIALSDPQLHGGIVVDREPPQARLQRLTLDVDDVAPLLGINRSTAYELIRRGTFPLPVIRLGRRIVVSRQAVTELLGGDAA